MTFSVGKVAINCQREIQPYGPDKAVWNEVKLLGFVAGDTRQLIAFGKIEFTV